MQAQSKRVGSVVRMCTYLPIVVHAMEELTAASQDGSQDTTMVGKLGSYFDFGSVSEGIPDPSAKICSVGAPSVCEGEVVENEVDSGADVPIA